MLKENMLHLKKLLLSIVFLLFFSFNLYAEGNYVIINYGISNHDIGATAGSKNADGRTTTITTDDDDTGFIFSVGRIFEGNWGVDLMYYDLGSSSIKVDKLDFVKIDNLEYEVKTAGTITNDISGYGFGLIGASDLDSGILGMSFYAKAGVHAWDKSGSTSLLDNNDAFAGSFYNQGIGGYAGLGLGVNIYGNTSLNITYDTLGLTNDAGFDNSSSLFGAGLKVNF